VWLQGTNVSIKQLRDPNTFLIELLGAIKDEGLYRIMLDVPHETPINLIEALSELEHQSLQFFANLH
jgi:hypothetical protein